MGKSLTKTSKAIYILASVIFVIGSVFAFSAAVPLAANAAPAYDYRYITQSAYPTVAPGASTTLWVEVKNTGTATWTSNVVRLGTDHPRDRQSAFANSSWLGSDKNRPCAFDPNYSVGGQLPPGYHTRFTLNVTAPTTPGTYREYFTPVADGVTWMKDIGIYWDITVSGAAQPEQPGQPSGPGLTVSNANTQAAGTIIEGALTNLATFTFTNGDSAARKVTTLKLKRTGVSADSTLTNTYLYQGGTRITDAATVSAGYITFTNSAGIFSIDASGSVNITVKSQIASGVSGQTVGVSINAATDVATDAASVNGTFPLLGNNMTIASATLATVAVGSPTPNTGTTDPVNDFVVWQSTITVGNRAVNLKYLKLREIGSINYSDLSNFRLYVDGVQVGSTVNNLNSSGYVAFDLTSSPKRMETGGRTVKVIADIVGGSSRNFSFSLQSSSDIMVTDIDYNADVVATGTPATTGTITINSGAVTITKATDSPSGNIANNSSDVLIGKFIIEARGEAVKIESLRVFVDSSDNTVGKLRNGKLYADGVQIGSTADILEDENDGPVDSDYTTYNLGSSLIPRPGTPVTLEIKSDIYDSDGTNNLTNGDTLTVYIEVNSSNAQAQSSLTVLNVPAASVGGNQLTVSEGTMALAKYTAYGNQTKVVPQTAFKIGSFVVTTGSAEQVDINNFEVDFTTTDALDPSDDLTNLYIKYGPTGTENTTSVKSTVADNDNNFSIANYRMNASSQIMVDVYATMASSSTDGDGTADTLVVKLSVTGTGVTTSSSLSQGPEDGQTITATQSGTVTVSVESEPLAAIVAGNQNDVEAARFKFVGTYDNYTITEMTIKVADTTVASAIQKVKACVGATCYEGALSGSSVTLSTNFSIIGDNPSGTVVSVKYNLNQIGAGYGQSGINAVATLDQFKYRNSQGQESSNGTDYTGNSLYVYKSIPTFTQVDLSNPDIINGSQMEIYKFTVAADAKGAIALKQLKLAISWNDDATTANNLELESVKIFRGTTDITSVTDLRDEDGNNVEETDGLLENDGTLVITFNSEEQIPAGSSYTYTIKATPQGFSDDEKDSFSIYMPGDSTADTASQIFDDGGSVGVVELDSGDEADNIIWSDLSAVPHSYSLGTSSADWANGYLAKNLDLGSETFKK